MGVPLLDLKAQWASIGDDVKAAIETVYDSQYFINGPQVKQFEAEIAEYCGSKHAIGCASGSDALVLAMMALGIGPGDEVILPTFTFFATAGAVSRVGATPVFADVDPDTLNLLPSEITRLKTAATKAVIPVHLFGQCADMDSIMESCKASGMAVIEDAAQSIGAKYKGKRVGQTGGDIVTFSFFPSKNLGCLGDGGMCVTNDDNLAEMLLKLRNHGAKPKYYHKHIGMNSRLDSLQAAALSVKLTHLEDWHEGRRKNGERYNEMLAGIPGLEAPVINKDCWTIYNQYTLRIKDGKRDEVLAALKDRGIGCEVYYPVCLHLQECYSGLGGKAGDCPTSELAAQEVISIPIYPEMTQTQQDEVIEAVKEVLGGAATVVSS